MSLLDNLFASGLFAQNRSEDDLSSLLSGLAPLVAAAPAMDRAAVVPVRQAVAASPVRRKPPNPLAGLSRGLTPEFVGLLTKRREMREAGLSPDYFKRKERAT